MGPKDDGGGESKGDDGDGDGGRDAEGMVGVRSSVFGNVRTMDEMSMEDDVDDHEESIASLQESASPPARRNETFGNVMSFGA